MSPVGLANTRISTGYDAQKSLRSVCIGQWSRLKPSLEFHFEGLSNFSSSVEGLVKIQDINPRIQMKYKTHIKLVHRLYGTCSECNVKN